MKPFFAFAATFFLVISLTLLPAAQPTKTDEDKLPAPADFPAAGQGCKRKVRLSPWVATPAVDWPRTYRCVLNIHTCDGVKTTTSGVRPGGEGMCSDYWKAHDALVAREICCDQGSPEKEQPPKEAPPKKACASPIPWFDGLSPDPKCKDRRTFQTSHDGEGWVFLKMCGQTVFAYKPIDKDVIEPYKAALLEYVRGAVGSTVCCDSFRASTQTGSSCDPRFDLDCDGTSNATDRTEDGLYPDISTLAVAPGVRAGDIVPHPPWFKPGDKDFMPAANLCDCKWEVKSARRECNLYEGRRHAYQLTWQCPSTGNVKFTRKEVPATEPCGPDPGTMGSFFGFTDSQYIDSLSYSFLGSPQKYRSPRASETQNDRAWNVSGW